MRSVGPQEVARAIAGNAMLTGNGEQRQQRQRTLVLVGRTVEADGAAQAQTAKRLDGDHDAGRGGGYTIRGTGLGRQSQHGH
ncbi:MAG TPA: hypothetical protein VG868_03385, partial [Casimicrobiaceae bacterium]|nr:hypothetical protein [Casimicrobiaceae bacterium]